MTKENLGGENGKSGENADSLGDDTGENQYVFDGLNYALIAQMNESYFKELMTLLESGRIDHSESDRNSQFELNRNSQCTLAN